jgi:hypothetical protein
METTKGDILDAKVKQLRSEGQHPNLCKVEGCEEPRREGKVRCDVHQREYQKEMYQKGKGKPAKKHPHPPEKAKVEDPRPAPEDYRPPMKDPCTPVQVTMSSTMSSPPLMLEDLVELLRTAGLVDALQLSMLVWGYLYGRGLAA